MGKRWLVALMLVLPAGCGSGQTPVFKAQGKVLYQGQPAAGAFISFHPLGGAGKPAALPRAQVAADGSFVLTTFAKDDGAPAGEYAVTIDWRLPVDNPEGGGETELGPNLLPPKYVDAQVTPLRVKIEPTAANELPTIDLTP